MTADVLTVLIPLGLAYAGLRLFTSYRVRPFNARRASLRARSLTGPNATLILSAAALAGLTLSIVSHAARWQTIAGIAAPLLVIFVVVGLVLLVIGGPRAGVVVGLLGLAAELASAWLEHGIAGAFAVLVLTVLILFSLALTRGFVR